MEMKRSKKNLHRNVQIDPVPDFRNLEERVSTF